MSGDKEPGVGPEQPEVLNENLSLTTYKREGVSIYSLSGYLEIASSQSLLDRLMPEVEAVEEGETMALGLSEVEFVDAAGIRTMHNLSNKCRDRGVNFALHDPSPMVSRILELSGATRDFEIVISEDEQQ